jgi:uncharacterized protein YggU (UPF0235/DUF167 family)
MYIRVKVAPNSKKETFIQVKDNSFVISVKEKAENNMANDRVLEILKEHFNVKRLRIINGHRGPIKLIAIDDL